METSVNQTMDKVSYTQSNPLFDLSLSTTDLYSFQPEDVKRARPRRQWCFNVVIVYLIYRPLLMPFSFIKFLNSFLILSVPVFTVESSVSEPRLERLMSRLGDTFQTRLYNNSRDTETLRGLLWALKSQVSGLCGEQGPMERLQAGLSLLNNSTHTLERHVNTISLQPGPPGSPGREGLQGPQGVPGERGLKDQRVKWDSRANLESLELMVKLGFIWVPGAPGEQGPGAKGEKGDLGPKVYEDLQVSMELKLVRLVPGPSRGRVEVQHNGYGAPFDTVDGKVICKMLGFRPPSVPSLPVKSNIFNCPHSGVGVNNCKHNEDAGLLCV
ncbi:hypothetical protein F7725_001548 [Dissostichus mawsoni]|uniref:SRCR domain-containing protein n=1 Tax=Dissostichus mawsoni TaxID=36200 RepID=A0A7J5Y1N0_DISMA|nr:hypothetical protein F7725_001548 [Dissostichus mawsoni]